MSDTLTLDDIEPGTNLTANYNPQTGPPYTVEFEVTSIEPSEARSTVSRIIGTATEEYRCPGAEITFPVFNSKPLEDSRFDIVVTHEDDEHYGPVRSIDHA